MVVARRSREPRRPNWGRVTRGAALFTPPCGELYPQTGATTWEPYSTGWTAQGRAEKEAKAGRDASASTTRGGATDAGASAPPAGSHRSGERRPEHRSAAW